MLNIKLKIDTRINPRLAPIRDSYRWWGTRMLLIPPNLTLIFRHRFERVWGDVLMTFLTWTHCVAIPNSVSPTRFTSAEKQALIYIFLNVLRFLSLFEIQAENRMQPKPLLVKFTFCPINFQFKCMPWPVFQFITAYDKASGFGWLKDSHLEFSILQAEEQVHQLAHLSKNIYPSPYVIPLPYTGVFPGRMTMMSWSPE